MSGKDQNLTSSLILLNLDVTTFLHAQPTWFGGDASNIVGSCRCSGITSFNDSKDAMSCETDVMPVVAIALFTAIAVIVGCYYIARCVYRRMVGEESFDEGDDEEEEEEDYDEANPAYV